MKNTVSLGVDIGSISTKGVFIDHTKTILAGAYIWTQGDPIGAVKRLLYTLHKQAPDAEICSIGTTGSARKLIEK